MAAHTNSNMNAVSHDAAPARVGLASGASLTPVSTDTPQKGRCVLVTVILLDDTESVFKVPQRAQGIILFHQVCKNLNLLETDYFGLEYTDLRGHRMWLEFQKSLWKQIGGIPNIKLSFVVKFYMPDPGQLEEEYTRYLFALQIKRDLVSGAMPCNDATAALLSSYIVQAECGDFVDEDYPDHKYLSAYKFVPHQCDDMERLIMENHKKHVGLSPADADYMLLDVARKVEMYGVRLHTAKDHEGVPLMLAVAHMGVHVFQNGAKINTFSWAKVRKLSFKRKRFLIKLHPEGFGYYKDTVEFYFTDRNHCKNFWKKCVEHHGFFRCATVKSIPRKKSTLLSKGSQFRYSGRTMKEMVDDVRESHGRRQPFQRSLSGRQSHTHSLVHIAPLSTSVPTINSTFSEPRIRAGSDTSGSHQVGLDSVNTPRSEKIDFAPSDSSHDATPSASPPAVHGVSPKRHAETPPSPIPESPVPAPLQHDENEQLQSGQLKSELHSQPANGVPTYPPPGPIFNSSVSQNQYHLEGNHIHDEAAEVASHLIMKEPPAVPLKRKAYPHDKSYYICKELLMTERTYKSDLEIITVLLRKELDGLEDYEIFKKLMTLIDPIYEVHCVLLREIEERLAQWEARLTGSFKSGQNRMCDVIVHNIEVLNWYMHYQDNLYQLLTALEETCKKRKQFEKFCRSFEMKKECYLPLNCFLMKPMHRLVGYMFLFESLLSHYSRDHVDRADCELALKKVRAVVQDNEVNAIKCENFVKLVEIQRDLGGIDSIVDVRREFVREGCLQKLSKKGYQQRMFFLFSDMLIYANRTSLPTLQFKVHGQLPTKTMIVEETPESKMAVPHCFALYSGSRTISVAAGCEEEKYKWIEDINSAIRAVKESDQRTSLKTPSLKNQAGSLDEGDVEESAEAREKSFQHRANTSMHVCWHRNTSIGSNDYNHALVNQLSGYLLRKFKNSDGWQKLWVVFTNFCLFFYKTHQDEVPLASLPLLAYTVSVPDKNDGINKEHAFKLQFKNHMYFFRAESEYSFQRWVDVVGNTTNNASRTRLFSRLDSNIN